MNKQKIRLGVNIDHIATLRNAREGVFPDLKQAAIILKENNVDSITIHLREDRRHIKDNDLYELMELNILPINLEMAATDEMVEICLNSKPYACCFVPEKRMELTTEGGLNIFKKKTFLRNKIINLKKKKIRVSLFVDPDFKQIKAAKEVGADAIEIHTGKYSDLFLQNNFGYELDRIIKSAQYARKIGIQCHAGHGLTYQNIINLTKIKEIEEFNIGHFIIGQSIFEGLGNSVKKFIKLIN